MSKVNAAALAAHAQNSRAGVARLSVSATEGGCVWRWATLHQTIPQGQHAHN